MTVTKTARQKLRNHTRYLDYTLSIYRDALQYVNRIAYGEWNSIEILPTSKHRINYIEHLIHSTSKNIAAYPDFDKDFYKFPSYFRRAVIAEALGNVSSHMTRLRKWHEKPKGKAPSFQSRCNSFPVFYKGVMSRWIGNGKVALKLYTGNDWIWFILPFSPIKTARFQKTEGWVSQNPMLVKKGKAWEIHFPFEKKIELERKNFIRPVLSVDLGLTTTAVCSVVCSDGTVLHRKFINYGREKDRLNNTLGRIAKKSAQTCMILKGEVFCKRYWREISNLTNEIAHRCSREIVGVAVSHGCQSIVFEHLGRLKVPKAFYGAKRLRKKFHYWLKGKIQRYTRYKALSEGMRFSRVLARGTSEYAYDGSGKIRRVGNRQIAVFSLGQKIYNCDLSASYNIAARYWIREILGCLKSLGREIEVATQDISSSVVAARHQQTLASLISLVRLLPLEALTGRALYSGQGISLEETATIAAA